MIASFDLLVDYTQILVYTRSHPAPGLLWTDEHVAQGFAWSEGLVSFGVPDHDGECRLDVDAGAYQPAAGALWAIAVPFSVTEPVRVGSVLSTHEVSVPEGSCSLVFEAGPGRDGRAFDLRLVFSPAAEPAWQILRKGGDITADEVLTTTAEIAR